MCCTQTPEITDTYVEVSVWSGRSHNFAKNPSVENEEQCTHYNHEFQFLTSRAQGDIFNLIYLSPKKNNYSIPSE